MKKIETYEGNTLYSNENGELFWPHYDEEGQEAFRLYYDSVEDWKQDVNSELLQQADAHSCQANATYTDQGPAGPGSYCSVCGSQVSSAEY